ncbi:MAG: glycosyltransferase family 2 protein [Actinomycetota bacterium]|nr:glycosyltransferase family 2 protein [Actinomycetota bacterium]
MSAMISIPSLLSGLDWAILFYFLAVNGFYLVLLAFATLEMRRHLLRIREESRWHVLGSEVAPTLSMIAPAHNEGSTVAESVRALLTLQYPNLEVVLVNDGSSDDTLAVLEREFELVPIHPIYRRRLEHAEVTDLYRSSVKPNLVVVDKRNGGKADALNAGLNVARGELVCAIDADTLIEPDALLRMARPFLNGSDVVAAGGTVRVVNGSRVKGGRVSVARAPRHPLAGIQAVEYLRAFLFGRLGWNRLGGNLIISGAFGLFRREPVIAAGGYLHDTVGEDMELVARLRRLGAEQGTSQRVEFIPDPVAWTEVPESLRVLGRQRDRWQRGLADVLWRHRHVMLRPRYGALGLVAFPYFVLVELLAPVVELVGLIGLGAALAIGAVDGSFALLFFLVAYGFGVLLTCLTLVLDDLSFPRYGQVRDRLVLVPWAVLESLGYRQLTAYWRLRGLVKFLRGRKDWGVMTRTGFAAQAELPGDSSV